MSDGMLSQDDVNKVIKGEIDLNEVVNKTDGDIPKEDLNLLLNAIDVYEQKKTKDFSLENRRLKFTDEQLGKIAEIFGSFAQMAANCFVNMLRCAVYVKVDSINQLTVGEVIHCIPAPTSLGFISVEPLKGEAVIEIDPNMTFAVLDIIRYGKVEITKSYNEFTQNEVNIIFNTFFYILENMKVAFSQAANIQPKLLRLETVPNTIKIAPVSEMTALVSLSVNAIRIEGIVNGMINFCIPYPLAESILGK